MDALWSSGAWPLATAVLALVFAVLVLRQWGDRRRAHQLAWGVGLVFFGVAAGLEAWSEATGHWSPGVYRVYVVLAASLVGFLGLGTLYLMTSRRGPGHLYLAYNLACLAVLSAWRFSRRKEYAYRTWANVLIAAGTAVIAFVGARARMGSTAGLYPAEMAASVLLLCGFLLAGTLDRGSLRARPPAA